MLQAQASNSEEQAALLQQSLAAAQANAAKFQAQLGTALTKNAELQNALTEKQTESVKNALTAIDDLYGSLPDTITGSQQKIVDKLAEPFGTKRV